MNRDRTLFLAFPLAGLLWAAAAIAEPAQVEVVAEDEEDDFFTPERAPAPRQSSPVQQGAAPRAVEVSPRSDPQVTPRPWPPAPSAMPQLRPPTPVAESQAGCRSRCSWWQRPSHVSEGDLMLSVVGGGFAGGGYGGLGIEGMASDQIGIRLMVRGAAFDGEDVGDGSGNNWNFFEAGRWGITEDITSENLIDGFAHLVDLDVTFHLFRRTRFDLYTSLGLSHFGYSLALDKYTLRGGSGFSKLGGGLNFHWRRFFAGADFGWYPYELIRYEIFRNEDGDYEADTLGIEDRYEPSRYTAVLRFGIRL